MRQYGYYGQSLKPKKCEMHTWVFHSFGKPIWQKGNREFLRMRYDIPIDRCQVCKKFSCRPFEKRRELVVMKWPHGQS